MLCQDGAELEIGFADRALLSSDYDGEHGELLCAKNLLPRGGFDRVVANYVSPYYSAALLKDASVAADDSFLPTRPTRQTYNRTFGQCAVTTHALYDQELLRRAVDAYITFLQRKGVARSRVWEWGDVYNHLRNSATAGFPFSGKNKFKGAAFRNCFPVIQKYWDGAFNYAVPVYCGSQKEEMRSAEKVRAEKFRLFCSGSLIDYCFALRLYGDWLCRLTDLNLQIGWWPGATHYHGGWDDLVAVLEGGIDDREYWTADCTKFDMTQSFEVLVDCVLPVVRAFGPIGYDDRVESVCNDIVECVLKHADGSLYYLNKNNKSGGLFTISVNMILQGVILMYTRLKHGYNSPWNYALCGDDNILVKTPDGFNPFVEYPSFGLVMKKMEVNRSIFDCEFLSKRFSREGKFLVATVDVEKHLCSMKYEPTNDAGDYVLKLNSIIMESAWSAGVDRLVRLRELVYPLVNEPGKCSGVSRQLAVDSYFSLEECKRMHFYVPEHASSHLNINYLNKNYFLNLSRHMARKGKKNGGGKQGQSSPAKRARRQRQRARRRGRGSQGANQGSMGAYSQGGMVTRAAPAAVGASFYGSIPQFTALPGSVGFLLKHKEHFLSVIASATAGTDNHSFQVNSKMVPYLKGMLSHFQHWTIRKLVAHWRPAQGTGSQIKVTSAFYNECEDPPKSGANGSILSFLANLPGVKQFAGWAIEEVGMMAKELTRSVFKVVGAVAFEPVVGSNVPATLLESLVPGHFVFQVDYGGQAAGDALGDWWLEYEVELRMPTVAATDMYQTYSAETASAALALPTAQYLGNRSIYTPVGTNTIRINTSGPHTVMLRLVGTDLVPDNDGHLVRDYNGVDVTTRRLMDGYDISSVAPYQSADTDDQQWASGTGAGTSGFVQVLFFDFQLGDELTIDALTSGSLTTTMLLIQEGAPQTILRI